MISLNTGHGQRNTPINTATLQVLLNKITIYQNKSSSGQTGYSLIKTGDETALDKLTIDGSSITKLTNRIKAYQSAKGLKVVDGWVSPKGNTIKGLLIDAKSTTHTTPSRLIREAIPCPLGARSIKATNTISLYQKQYKTLLPADKEGLKHILETAKKDVDITLISELAYMLATIKHETAHTFRSIAEYGKGNGYKYGTEVEVTHTDANKKSTTYKNKYYGRGYVQLTWGYNYQRIDEKLGFGTYPNKNKIQASEYNKGFTIHQPTKSIYLNPNKALEKENAYIAMVYGMQKGIFTGKKIGSYINKIKTDYVNARRVINGTDKAQAIANYATTFELLLLIATR